MVTGQKRTITAEDLYDFEVINACEISPNGEKIIYAVQSVDKENEKKYNHLWIVDTQTGGQRQLTFGNHKNSDPKWSPDGQWIAFMSNRQDENQFQLFLMPFEGGESFPITDLRGDIGDFDWSPGSDRIVFQFRRFDPEDIAMIEDKEKKELGRVSRRISNRVFFKLDGYGYLPKERYNLWIVDIKTKALTQLSESDIYDETGPVWSPDGKFIAFFSNRTDQPDLNPGNIDLFLYDFIGESVALLNTPEGPKSHASFSKDSSKISYIGFEGLKSDYKNQELWVIDFSNDQIARSLTKSYDINIDGGVLNDVGSEITSSPIWSKDGKEIYFQVDRYGRTTLNKIDLANQKMETLIEFDGVVSGFSMDKERSTVAFIHATMTDPGQIAVCSIVNPQPHLLTSLNKDRFDRLDLGEVEEIWFKGSDGNDLQGWVIKPPDFDPDKKYPSIMEIHGGPLLEYGYYFMHEFFYLAAQGYVVYFCNPRGGQGYGEEHAKAIYYGKWGTVDYEDLMAWADYVEKLSYIDNEKMGVTGGSYGGYMTIWIIGHTNRFKAAVSQRCVSNLISMWGSSDFNWSFQHIFDDKAPYENLDVLWECSPMKYIANAQTPTLLIHSMQDLRCAIEQSEQVYVALKKLGVTTEFLIFPDSPHGLSRTGRTDRKIVRLHGISDWFDQYLKN